MVIFVCCFNLVHDPYGNDRLYARGVFVQLILTHTQILITLVFSVPCQVVLIYPTCFFYVKLLFSHEILNTDTIKMYQTSYYI